MGFVAKIYPNGEFTAGECHVRRLQGLDGMAVKSKPASLTSKKRYFVVPDNTNNAISHGLSIGDRLILHGQYLCSVTKVTGLAVTLEVITATGKIPYEIKSVPEFRKQFPIGLSLVPKLTHPENSRISKYDRNVRTFEKGIRSKARRNIRNYCYLLEERYGKKNLGFLTLTMPSELTREEENLVLANWSKIRTTFTRRFVERLKRKGGTGEYVCVTELQERRGAKFDYIYPHLHLLFAGRKNFKAGWLVTPKVCRKIWIQAIRKVCGIVRPIAGLSTENLQGIKRSAAGYLSKYLSKGSSNVGDKPTEGITGALSILELGRWYTCSQSLTQLLGRVTVRISDRSPDWKIARCILTRISTLAEMGYTQWGNDGIINISNASEGDEGKPRGLAWSSGRFSPDVAYPVNRLSSIYNPTARSFPTVRRRISRNAREKKRIDWTAVYTAQTTGDTTLQNLRDKKGYNSGA